MPTISVAGLSTHYEQIGTGPRLYLFHGWANTWEAWLPVIPKLADRFTLMIPDLPGCGDTQAPLIGWTTRNHAQWLEHFIHETEKGFEENQFFVCGHSYGGKMLLEYCSGDYDRQPQKIILISASGIPNILSPKQKLLKKLASLTPTFVKRSVGKKMKQTMYSQFGADSDYVNATEFGKKTLQLVLTEDYTEKLSSIQQPTLLLWGKNDTSAPLWQGEIMHSLIPLNRILSIEAGHFPHHEFPDQILKEIIEFLS